MRGLRSEGDLEHDLPMAQMNYQLNGIETMIIPANAAQAYISSTVTSADRPSDSTR